MKRYRGRFAPSPTGPLHLGSLFAAVVSFLDAKVNDGQWLLRVEDIDRPREVPGATQHILESLEAHGLVPDEPVVYQSSRDTHYSNALQQLVVQGHCYPCPCSRKDLANNKGQHLPNCRTHEAGIKHATRFKCKGQTQQWDDLMQGRQSISVDDDFVVQRKDGLYAYQLAVVVDDIAQAITHVIRGADLLSSTPMQLALYRALGAQSPAFGHFPVLLNCHGQKLSKQNLSPAIDKRFATENLKHVFELMGLNLQQTPTSPKHALELALEDWQHNTLSNSVTIESS